MRISVLALLVFFGLLAFQPAFAIYPFGGKIVAFYSSGLGFCGEHEEIVVVGPRGGVFALRGYTQWVAGAPLPVAWVIGIADIPPPLCSTVLIAGSSAPISLLPPPNQLSFVNHSSTPQWQ